MNSWLRSLVTLCVVLSILSLGALGWLAFVTTEAGKMPEDGLEAFTKSATILSEDKARKRSLRQGRGRGKG